jgi:ribosomal protein S18 acetylase RimI-like enzyme
VWRLADAADAPALVSLLRACDRADGTDDASDHGLDNAVAGAAIIALGDKVAAGGWIERRGSRWHLCGGVRPEHRRQGLGAALTEWQLRTARSLAEGTQPGPHILRIDRVLCAETAALPPDATALFVRAGLRFNYIEDEMHRDLPTAFAGPDEPPSVQLARWTEDIHARVLEAYNDAFRGRGFAGYNEADWRTQFVAQPEFSAAHSLIALDGGEIAGFLFSLLPDAGSGWIDSVGVRPAYRCQGIGTALITATMRGFTDAGLEQAALRVNIDNESAARLYRRLGFVTVRRHVSYVGSIEPR